MSKALALTFALLVLEKVYGILGDEEVQTLQGVCSKEGCQKGVWQESAGNDADARIERDNDTFQTWEIGPSRNPLHVIYKPSLDGGGRSYAPGLIRYVFNKIGRSFRCCFEFCAGPGFIGFAFLSVGICESLVLADTNPRAVEAARRTVAENGLHSRVRIYQSSSLQDISVEEFDSWDLVLSNPPHFLEHKQAQLIFVDPNWNIHRSFYAGIHHFLQTNAHIVFIENRRGSMPEDFIPLLPQALQVRDISVQDIGPCRFGRHLYLAGEMYFMHISTALGAGSTWLDTQKTLCELQWILTDSENLLMSLVAVPDACAGEAFEESLRSIMPVSCMSF